MAENITPQAGFPVCLINNISKLQQISLHISKNGYNLGKVYTEIADTECFNEIYSVSQ